MPDLPLKTKPPHRSLSAAAAAGGRVRGFSLMSTLSQNAQAAAWRTRQPRRKYNYTYFVEIVVIIK